MKCVHGKEMIQRCLECEDPNRAVPPYSQQMSDGESRRWFMPEPAQDVESRLATELASIARSIQGLSGNAEALLKLTIEREARAQLAEPGSTWSPALQDALKINQQKAAELDAREVKHGPVTDEEFWQAFQAWTTGESTRDILTTFAKSRGLID